VNEPERPPRARRILFRCAALLGAFVVALVLLEGMLRVQAWAKRDVPEWQPEPVAPGNPTPLDLRGPRYAFDEGQYRVLVLGDSFMWGDQVDAVADIFPVRLAHDLAERRGSPVEVVSLAQRGFTALASARALETYGVPMHPQLVIYGFYLNDGFRNFPDGTYLIWQDLWDTLLPEPANGKWKARSKLYEKLAAAYLAYQVGTDPRGWNKLYEDGTVEWQQFDEALRRMAEAGRREHAPVVVVLWPDFAVTSFAPGEYRYAAIHAKVRDRANRYGLVAFDLTKVFAEKRSPPQSWCARAGNCHPNADAHHIAADAVAEFLSSTDLNPPSPH